MHMQRTHLHAPDETHTYAHIAESASATPLLPQGRCLLLCEGGEWGK